MNRLSIQVYGRHVVEEALRADAVGIESVISALGFSEEEAIRRLAQSRNATFRHVDCREMDRRAGTSKHQNLCASVRLPVWDRLKEWFGSGGSSEGASLGVALDEVVDPQNVGALFRSARYFGADFLLMTRDRASPITASVAKASAGALFWMPLVRAVNLAREIEYAKDQGFLAVGLAPEVPDVLCAAELGRKVLLVVGGEGCGLRALTRTHCDVCLAIPGAGVSDSLNAGVAGALALYEVFRQRRGSP